MPPSKQVTGNNVVDALVALTLEGEKPYATTTDIAEELGVTAQTIRNNASEISEDPRIEKGKVGQSSVYWLAVKYDPEELDDPPEHVREMMEASATESDEELQAGLDGEQKTRHDQVDRPTESAPTDQSRVERLAKRRIAGFGAIFLGLAVVFAPLGVDMVVGGSVLPGAMMLVLAGFCLLNGVGLILVAAVAQWYLERPLKELLTGAAGNVASTEAKS